MTVEVEPFIWILYHILILTFIAIDLFAGLRRTHALNFREATRWVVLWISVAILFGIFVLYRFGLDASTTYFAVYFLEYTLSMDNLFVFAVIFMYFAVPPIAQPVVLYVGIISAIVMRASFIFIGILLLETFEFMIFVFGTILIYSGIKVWSGAAERINVERNPVIRWARRFLPLTDSYHGAKFVLRGSKSLMLTPLVLVLLTIETTDIVFAVDSVPAALVLVEHLPDSLKFFIAYSGNVAAVLGLRSLYFLIALTMFKFRFISKGLAFILVFLGTKFFLSGVGVKIEPGISIAVIFIVLAIAILASILIKQEGSEPSRVLKG